jgi:hypothetical protein
MAIDRTEQLIAHLALDVSPVKRLPAISIRIARWLGLAIAASAVAVMAIGVRPNVWRAITEPAVWQSLAVALLASISAAVVAMRLSVPGAQQSRYTRWLPMAIIGVWIATLVRASQNAGVSVAVLSHESFHAACVARVTMAAIVPTYFLIRAIRRGFALDAASTMALAALGGTALAAAAVQLVCPIDRAAHVLMSHVLPALGLVAPGALAGRLAPRVLRG